MDAKEVNLSQTRLFIVRDAGGGGGSHGGSVRKQETNKP